MNRNCGETWGIKCHKLNRLESTSSQNVRMKHRLFLTELISCNFGLHNKKIFYLKYTVKCIKS